MSGRMVVKNMVTNERGMALVAVLLVTLAIATLAVTAVMLSTNSTLVMKYRQRETLLQNVADAGIEEARSAVNADRSKTLMPDTGYRAYETNAVVYDANGTPIPNVKRTTYIGPTGITSGQYGVYASAVTVVSDAFGNTLVRRGEIYQESFAKYAYFTNTEGAIQFANGDQIYGPVHSNDVINIGASGATFFGPLSTARTINGRGNGTYKQGYTERAANIPFPTVADLNKLRTQAAAGNMVIASSGTGAAGQATVRIEFVALDLDGDGKMTGDNEGFIRVYQSDNPAWVVASPPANYGNTGLRDSENCGDFHSGVFKTAHSHYLGTSGTTDSWVASLNSVSKRCYLGGSDSLWGAFVPNDLTGQWLRWPGAVSPLVALRPDGQYLWPITRALNPNFKGVIFVDGNVAISGRLRGRVTLAATRNIVIADNVTYATDPGLGTCADMLGLFAGLNIVVADNTLNSPQQPQGPAGPFGGNNNYKTYKPVKDEFIHAVLLTLNQFTAENYTSGPTNVEGCQNLRDGRGCLYLTGGVIQQSRGPVGLTDGHGYIKRYSYDACGMTNPPPYFPTTGHYTRGHYFEVDPTSFDVASYFKMLTPP
jgi:type II secretory pathway pseudopilin PulG